MDQGQFEDIKELVQTTASNTEISLKKDLDRIESKMANGFAGVGNALSNLSEHIDDRFDNVESRLTDHEIRTTRLEQAA